MNAVDLAQRLRAKFPGSVSEPAEFRREFTVRISNLADLLEIFRFAKAELGFDYLVDLSSLDNLGDDPRFTVVYHISGIHHRCQLRVKVDVSEEQGEVPSVTGIWRGADWHEREVFDMMGLRFAGHPDLRRILMWDGYPYFPLRKDFPLAGKPSQMPEVAFTNSSPMAGGPFTTIAGGKDAVSREPRARIPDTDGLETNARLERRKDIQSAHGKAYGPGPIEPPK